VHLDSIQVRGIVDEPLAGGHLRVERCSLGSARSALQVNPMTWEGQVSSAAQRVHRAADALQEFHTRVCPPIMQNSRRRLPCQLNSFGRKPAATL